MMYQLVYRQYSTVELYRSLLKTQALYSPVDKNSLWWLVDGSVARGVSKLSQPDWVP